MAIYGIIGLILLVIGWIPQTIQTIKTKASGLNLKFNILYLLGSLFLAYHAILIKDVIFAVLNLLVAIMSGIVLFYKWRY